jgi:plastocyanin
MRKPIALFVTAALLVATGVAFAATAVAGGSGATTHAAAVTKTVVVGDDFFKPKKLKVKKGTFVKWVWGDSSNSGTLDDHNVTGAKGNRFSSGDTAKPDKPYKRKITKSTTVICTIHPTTMVMKIAVVK